MNSIPNWLQEALEQPTIDVPIAGRALGLSRNGSYEAAARGQIKTIEIGRLKRVPTSWLRKVLGLDESAAG
jgi:hypothetical protein